MQSTNYALAERLENVYRSMSLSPHHNGTGNVSLLNEMEMSDSEKSLNAARRPFSQIDEDEDIECDNPNPEIRINNEIPSEVSMNISVWNPFLFQIIRKTDDQTKRHLWFTNFA